MSSFEMFNYELRAEASLLAIDPSTRSTGWASYCLLTKKFLDGGVVKAKGLEDMLKKIGSINTANYKAIIIEKPQVYNLRTSKGNPKGLIDIAIIGGALSTFGEEVKFVTPSEWKGSLPKQVHHTRFLEYLKTNWLDRRVIIEKLSKINKTSQGDFLDACALGRWALDKNVFKDSTIMKGFQ